MRTLNIVTTAAAALSTSFLLASTAALSGGPSVCVLDGGGSPDDRACGAERAVSDIASTYRAMGSSANYQLLIGTGKNGQPSCTTTLGTCSGGNCRAAGSDSWNASTGAYDRVGARTQQNLDLKNAPGPLSAGTSDSFDKNCFFDSAQPPQNKIPVCNLWTTNHGAPEGVTFAQTDPAAKDQYMNADRLRPKADGCNTFKYVTDSCYGAQLGDVIYTDKTKQHVTPGRCGMAAAPRGYQAPGSAAADMDAPGKHVQVVSGELNKRGLDTRSVSDSVPLQIYYPMLENMADDAKRLSKQKAHPQSLDDMQASALLNDAFQAPTKGKDPTSTMLPGLVPTLSSDIYLADALNENQGKDQSTHNTNLGASEGDRRDLVNRALKPGLNKQVTEIMQCIPTGRSPSAAIDQLVTNLAPVLHMNGDSGFTPDEVAEMQFDLKSEAAKVSGFKDMNCKGNMLGSAIAGAHGVDTSSLAGCDFEVNYGRYTSDRDKRLTEVDAANKSAADARAVLNAQCATAHVTPCADTAALDQRLRQVFRTDCQEGGLRLRIPTDGDAIIAGAGNSCPAAYQRVQPLMEARNALLKQKTATLALEKTAAENAKNLEDFLGVHAQERHYEALKLRMAQVMDFYQHADPAKVRDYLALRRCELGDFDKPAPANWAELQSQRHLAATH